MSFKQRAQEELRTFLFSFIYLSLFFSVFIAYRNLVLSEYALGYFRYGYGLFEALVISKMILLGQRFRLGEKFEGYPLIVPTLNKTVVFSLFVIVLSVVEHYIGGFLHHKEREVITHELFESGMDEILSRSLVKFVAFIPFFAFLELDKVLGETNLFNLFFRRRKHS